MTGNLKCSFTIIFFVVFKLFDLQAQNISKIDSVIDLKEVSVIYQANLITPFTFQNISKKDFQLKITGQEPSFLLSETPSISSYSDAGNSQGYSYFRLRGIDQTRINITLDGVPLNEPEDQGAYFSNYPDIINSVSKIQIQRGVGTSKNGVASYAGSIQLFSPNLHDSTKTTFGIGYGSFNSFRIFGEFNSGFKNNKAIYVRASQIYSDGYKYNSSNNSQSVFVSTGLFKDKSNWKMNLLAGHQQNELAWLGVSDSLISIDRRTNADENERDEFLQCLAQLQNNWFISSSSNLQSSIYYTFLKGNYDFNLNNFIGLPSTDEMYNYAFQSNLIGFFSNYTFSKKNFTWISGIHGNVYDRQHIGSEKTLGQLYKNTGYKKEFSIFTKLNYSIQKISLFTDIQYRFSTFNYVGSVEMDKINWNFINPKAGISFEASKNSVIYYSIGRTEREPTRNDMFYGSDDLPADSTGNPIIALKTPESVINQELGFRFQSQKLVTNFNFYYMDFKNEIVLDGKFGPNGLALTNNVDKSLRTGVELNFSYELFENFYLINNSSYNYSKIKEQTETFSPILTPPLIINQEINYSIKSFLFGISARYQDKSFIDFANSTVLDDYFVLNASVQYKIKNFDITIFAYNITNEKYYSNGYVDFDGTAKYFVQAPVNFYLSAKYSF